MGCCACQLLCWKRVKALQVAVFLPTSTLDGLTRDSDAQLQTTCTTFQRQKVTGECIISKCRSTKTAHFSVDRTVPASTRVTVRKPWFGSNWRAERTQMLVTEYRQAQGGNSRMQENSPAL